MKLKEIKEKAEELGLDAHGRKKEPIVLAIQDAEGNTPCFGTNEGDCPFEMCCFMDDCRAQSRRNREQSDGY